ncbi:ABC transporter ATP-binding protein [Jannaschia seohaensis]|uniref:Peptide/nickel transport system ATP-binding protein/peptide/nickel transport system ATP-binding protein n=1 Tax=Jannaschia seohaensis TaxID=475081 RepID=A0A2Y9B4M8_9RHOB|nr:ABC transporter ATP-binding protein [Jannaschia seohaensis]PWJ11165.1 peptide/nickel transport system ATP-binding protein/peptide/nickel transport system ATP-binding protein [Jannaschia seohaensis]SSA51466.1 peptide/nickel transport system ATP-binding protein/peptide/nickel transport system ATP-binding protein [Jannaschia seohaensis]
MSAPLLEVDGLEVEFLTRRGTVHAVRGISFDLGPATTMGLVGESGCGKSVTAMALMGLVDLPGRLKAGRVRWKGRDILNTEGDPATEAYRREVCGRDIAMIFQDPMTSLDPLFTIGAQIAEVLERHRGMSANAARTRATELLDLVQIPHPEDRVDQYPHEFSGGMRQRALIAMALAAEPDLLIADEPTTALDVTVQAGILDLLADLQARLGLSILMITHDLGVVARLCQRVAVMYAGEIAEEGAASRLLHAPEHPYSAGLLAATPRLMESGDRLSTIEGQPPDLRLPRTACAFRPRCANAVAACAQAPDLRPLPDGAGRLACHNPMRAAPRAEPRPTATATAAPARTQSPDAVQPLVRVEDLTVTFPVGKQRLFGPARTMTAVDGVSFEIYPGETLGLVGESGSGKTTTGRALLRAAPISSGRVTFDGQDVGAQDARALRRLRRDMQLIFQDPYSSLNPRMTIAQIVGEPLIVHGLERDPARLRARVEDLLGLVGLPADAADRHPHAFSGGQRQRVGIARALTLEPRLIIADEPVSALDVSIRAQVVNLMQDLQARLGLTYLFIAHDLAVVRHIADRVAIMQKGRIVEIGPVEQVYFDPQHPYTRSLLASVPEIDDSPGALTGT